MTTPDSASPGPSSAWSRVAGGLRHCGARLAAGARWAAGAGIDTLYPHTCAACETELPDGRSWRLLCDDCRSRLVRLDQAWCPRCAAPAGPYAASETGCRECLNEAFPFESAVTLGGYREQAGPTDGHGSLLRSLILQAKASGGPRLMAALAQELLEVRRGWFQNLAPDAIVPVPHFWAQRLVRGDLAPQTIGAVLARQLRRPLQHDAVRKTRWTLPQAGLPGSNRRANLRNAFAWAGRPVAGLRLLVVDDVMTTGATVKGVAKVLLEAGAKEVHVAVLARSVN